SASVSSIVSRQASMSRPPPATTSSCARKSSSTATARTIETRRLAEPGLVDRQDDLPEPGRIVEALVRGRRLGEREDAVNDGAPASRRDVGEERVELPRAAHRRSLDAPVAEEEASDVDLA